MRTSRFLTQLTLFGRVKSAGLRSAIDHPEALLLRGLDAIRLSTQDGELSRPPRSCLSQFAVSHALPCTVERYSVSRRGCRCRCLYIPTSLGLSLPFNTRD